ncbi:MAG: helix-turn-helix transcriptional regulator [Rikenellaceae bacterium]
MPKNFNYINKLISHQTYKNMVMPIVIESGGFIVCTKGSSEIIINSKQYHLREHNICIAFPYSVVRLCDSSEDFEGLMIGVDIDFLINTPIDNKMLHYANVIENPCMSLTANEATKIVSLSELFLNSITEPIHPFCDEINKNIGQIIIFEVLAVYSKRTPISPVYRNRSEVIFDKFLLQLFQDYKKQRKLEYYASCQHITATHLSKIVKQVTGHSATGWIVDCVIANLKIDLQRGDMTIYQISELYNFPNSSYFSQYFKKYSGITPKKYISQ